MSSVLGRAPWVENDKSPIELRFHARLTEGVPDVELVVV